MFINVLIFTSTERPGVTEWELPSSNPLGFLAFSFIGRRVQHFLSSSIFIELLFLPTLAAFRAI